MDDNNKTRGQKRRLLLVTGLSGAGLSTALKALEDAGYQVIDNLPLSMLPDLLRQGTEQGKPVAVGVDSRTWGFTSLSLLDTVQGLKQRDDLAAELVFLDCQDAILQQRYTETRRTHPLAADRTVSDGVALERVLLDDVKAGADHVIDTTDLNVHDLRRLMSSRFAVTERERLKVFVMSFGFKNGLPREADLVLDVRFLENPHWVLALRGMTGLDAPVADRIRADKGYAPFFEKMTSLLVTLLPRYYYEGKSYLTLALGCTGGRHRSVFVAEELGKWLEGEGYGAIVRHRDLPPHNDEQKRKTA